jgi:hypothetical protein
MDSYQTLEAGEQLLIREHVYYASSANLRYIPVAGPKNNRNVRICEAIEFVEHFCKKDGVVLPYVLVTLIMRYLVSPVSMHYLGRAATVPLVGDGWHDYTVIVGDLFKVYDFDGWESKGEGIDVTGDAIIAVFREGFGGKVYIQGQPNYGIKSLYRGYLYNIGGRTVVGLPSRGAERTVYRTTGIFDLYKVTMDYTLIPKIK